MKEPKDSFYWPEFQKATELRAGIIPESVTHYNRCVCSTNNFFAILGTGAFLPGYLLVLPKENLLSYAHIPVQHRNEMVWFVRMMSNALETTYNAKSVIAEHGLCGTVGGARGHAHLHVFQLPHSVSESSFARAINLTFERRMIGIEGVRFNKRLYADLCDMQALTQVKKEYGDISSISIEGRLLRLEEINEEYDAFDLVGSSQKAVKDVGRYVYFRTPWRSTSFLTGKDLKTQILRELVFNAIADVHHVDQIRADWKWEKNPCRENMLQTMRDIAPVIAELEKNPIASSYGLNSHAVPCRPEDNVREGQQRINELKCP